MKPRLDNPPPPRTIQVSKPRRVLGAIALGCTLVAAGTLPSDREANAQPAGPAGSHGAPKKGSCPLFKVCLWTANDFNGTRGVFTPVPPGQCRKVGDTVTHAWSSAVNHTLVSIRLWQLAEITKDGARCGVEGHRRNGIVRPFHVARQFSFHTAEGLGGL